MHVEVVFHASIKSRVCLLVPLPMTEALSKSDSWPVVRQWRARRSIHPVFKQRLCVHSYAQRAVDQFRHLKHLDSPSMSNGTTRPTVSVLAKAPSNLLAFPEMTCLACELWQNWRDEGIGQSFLKRFWHKIGLSILGGNRLAVGSGRGADCSGNVVHARRNWTGNNF